MGRFEDGMMHLEMVRKLNKNNDFLGTRMEYLKAVESFKQANSQIELEKVTAEYEEFVKDDPIFKELISFLMLGIKGNPGILQSEITNKAVEMNWSEIYKYNRPLAKDDLYYALYFGDKFGLIKRNKKVELMNYLLTSNE
ncbi:hypothetical protein K7I13_07270 [Brucepastera parasyntrophica]|uniref:hypothetical protein n=1 Tax=Brucepastera parasyntrophica TaxID=2880008 RepID=UPI00210DE2A4|nr:hypothetical protein [Brucepastera parasyntrophica]ULQ61044.1 hypothetical protein K7I13_07270 [Brucepastera parasyntrophica]